MRKERTKLFHIARNLRSVHARLGRRTGTGSGTQVRPQMLDELVTEAQFQKPPDCYTPEECFRLRAIPG